MREYFQRRGKRKKCRNRVEKIKRKCRRRIREGRKDKEGKRKKRVE